MSRHTAKKKAFTTRVFTEFYRIAKDRLEAVQNGLGDAEIPSPPEPKIRRIPVPPVITQQPTPFGDR